MPDNKHKDSAVCTNHSVTGGRKDSVFWYATSPAKPELHPEICSKKYHTEKNDHNWSYFLIN